jgi:hypothetical protein
MIYHKITKAGPSSPAVIHWKVDCDPLMKIKRRIGCTQLEEFCAKSDKQLLLGSGAKGIEKNVQIVLAPLSHESPDC